MRLPKNGKVIILDNEPNEATPLMQVLAKNKIPYVYFTGDADFLPNEGEVFDDIRVLFLDINLTHNAVYETTIAQLNNTLKRIVKPGSPYIAAIWSNNQEDHIPLIDELFNNRASNISPISKIFLNKSDFFQYDIDGYILDSSRPNVFEDLEQRISSSLNQVDSIRLLMEWENSILESSTETILGISKITESDSYWNDNLKHLYYKLAHAQLGKNMINHNNTSLQQAALNTLTRSFHDRVEMKISNITINPEIRILQDGKSYLKKINGSTTELSWENFTYRFYINDVEKARGSSIEKLAANNNVAEKQILADFKSLYSVISPRLNAELLISKNPAINFHPGNVYHKLVVGKRKRKLLKTYFPKIEERDGNGDYKTRDLSVYRFVEVECTPICDFSQAKGLRYRFLPGVLFQADTQVKLDENLDSIYREIPLFEFEGKKYKLVFDYRLFKSINKEDLSKLAALPFLFRIKAELLIDIQARISSHVNRPGIITIS